LFARETLSASYLLQQTDCDKNCLRAVFVEDRPGIHEQEKIGINDVSRRAKNHDTRTKYRYSILQAKTYLSKAGTVRCVSRLKSWDWADGPFIIWRSRLLRPGPEHGADGRGGRPRFDDFVLYGTQPVPVTSRFPATSGNVLLRREAVPAGPINRKPVCEIARIRSSPPRFQNARVNSAARRPRK